MTAEDRHDAPSLRLAALKVAHKYGLDARRLLFARMLYEHGRIGEWEGESMVCPLCGSMGSNPRRFPGHGEGPDREPCGCCGGTGYLQPEPATEQQEIAQRTVAKLD